jgi:hypothetical protein
MLSLDNIEEFNPQAWVDHEFSHLSEATLNSKEVQSVLQLSSAGNRQFATILGRRLRIRDIQIHPFINPPLIFNLPGERHFYRFYAWQNRLAIESYRPGGQPSGLFTPKTLASLEHSLERILRDCAD